MNKKGFIYLAIAVFAFSTMEIGSKFIANDFNPLQLNFLRFFIGGLTLLPLAIHDLKKRTIAIKPMDTIPFILLGLLNVVVSMSLFQAAILYTKASIIAVLISSNALFVAPLSYFILKEKMDKSIIMSLVAGIIGMVIIAKPSPDMSSRDFTGILLAIGASITFALFSVLGKKLTPKFGGLALNAFSSLSGSVLMIPVLLCLNIPLFAGIKSSNILNILYLGFVVSAAAYVFMFKGLALLPANKGSLVFFVKPVLAGLLAYIALGETFSRSLIIGTIFILIGIMFTIVSGSKSKSGTKANA